MSAWTKRNNKIKPASFARKAKPAIGSSGGGSLFARLGKGLEVAYYWGVLVAVGGLAFLLAILAALVGAGYRGCER
ncbi:hypothetical protein KS4_23130 [Poriferisphaera corsica]|uniref:Uncharacterized protein n=1 Tax=Poriferisphaera corsica TaxID=2528020 RepID=A0A517YVJ5_9BACT|nr:hypothetical protein [Poriferisphaera corsica]QDU34247.1 hypothetical protein KS4_23130 [Poriferisphaera corsica]